MEVLKAKRGTEAATRDFGGKGKIFWTPPGSHGLRRGAEACIHTRGLRLIFMHTPTLITRRDASPPRLTDRSLEVHSSHMSVSNPWNELSMEFFFSSSVLVRKKSVWRKMTNEI